MKRINLNIVPLQHSGGLPVVYTNVGLMLREVFWWILFYFSSEIPEILFFLPLLNIDKIKLFEIILFSLWCACFLKGGFVVKYVKKTGVGF